MTSTDCSLCTRPARDGAFVCDPCGDTFAKDLKALVDWLDEDLETCIAGTKGVDWSKGAPRGGGEAGLRVNWRATAIYRSLHRALSEASDHCIKVGIRHSSTTEAEPARTVSAMALWLTWRVDGLCLDPAGPVHVGGISGLVEGAQRITAWEPPERRFLGPCEICGSGHVYAEGEETEAYCNRCEEAFPAEMRHAALVDRLDEQLLTAAQIGELSTYLGLRKDREKVRKQVNLWNHRKVIEAKIGEGDKARFRLGDVRHRLVAQDEAQ